MRLCIHHIEEVTVSLKTHASELTDAEADFSTDFLQDSVCQLCQGDFAYCKLAKLNKMHCYLCDLRLDLRLRFKIFFFSALFKPIY